MSYKIVIEHGSFKAQVAEIKPRLIIADRNVEVPVVDTQVEYLEVSEQQKNFDFYFQILNLLDQYQLNRNDSVMFVGGGVLIDVGSFAASTFKRGINYVNVPTTTLSMIDSSVGSKNGLNYLGVKNLIGNITDPNRVIIDTTFLKTLDARNYNNGLAEAIKIGYLSNPQILELLNCPVVDIEEVIRLSVCEKMKYVAKDKQDAGYRNYLNFGHTFGHALESITDFKLFYHGEAISIGMVIASGYDRYLISLLEKFDLPTQLPFNINVDKLIELMHGDKKNTSDLIKVVLKNPQQQIIELTNKGVKNLINTQLEVANSLKCNKIVVNKSKSHIHRLLAGALATKSLISFEFDKHNDLSDDVVQTINVVTNSGGAITYQDNLLVADCRRLIKPKSEYYIFKSATTYRMFTPILCSLFGAVEIKLDSQLQARPHTPFMDYIIDDTHNLNFDSNHYQIDGSISSQFISGYILAIIASGHAAEIEITGDLTSIPYIDMTISVIKQFGFNVTRIDNLITVNNVKLVTEQSFRAEPDFSSLAYFVTYNKLAKIRGLEQQVEVEQFDGQSLQADSVIYDILDLEVIDLKHCPDLLPTLVVYGLFNKRGIKLTNVDRIKFKECDRIQAMIENFADLQAIKLEGSELIVNPVEVVSGRKIKTFGDHRIAMATTIAAPFCSGPIVIDDYTVVGKSFPTFFTQWLGGSNERFK